MCNHLITTKGGWINRILDIFNMLHFLDVFDIGYIGYVLFFELLPLGCWI